MDSKKYGRKHIGKVFRTSEGYECTVIDGGSKRNYVTVKIKDWISEIQSGKIKLGQVAYPYNKSICNIGFFGEGKYSSKLDRSTYNRWMHMIMRCYDENQQKKQPTYIGCTVDESWHNFQIFAEWNDKYYPKDGLKYDLDKDIKVPGNKVYGKDTCIFVHPKLNAFVRGMKSSNTSGVTGVRKRSGEKKFSVCIYVNGRSKNLGRFTDINKASETYKTARDIEAKRLRNYYSFDYPKEILENIK